MVLKVIYQLFLKYFVQKKQVKRSKKMKNSTRFISSISCHVFFVMLCRMYQVIQRNSMIEFSSPTEEDFQLLVFVFVSRAHHCLGSCKIERIPNMSTTPRPTRLYSFPKMLNSYHASSKYIYFDFTDLVNKIAIYFQKRLVLCLFS